MGLENHLYSIFPISPDRIILIASVGIDGAPKSVVPFSDEILKQPKVSKDNAFIKIRVKKIYEKDVKYLNSMLMKEAYYGFAMRAKQCVNNTR